MIELKDVDGAMIRIGSPVMVTAFNINEYGLVTRLYNRVTFNRTEEIAEVKLDSGRFVNVTGEMLIKTFRKLK